MTMPLSSRRDSTSRTQRSDTHRSNCKHLHAYRLPAGTKIIYLGGSEEEIILPRGFNLSKYRIK